MAVTRENRMLRFNIAGDEVLIALTVTKMIWRGEATSVFGTDALQVVDPTATGVIIWEATSPGAYGEVYFQDSPLYCPRGLRVETMTADRGALDVYYA